MDVLNVFIKNPRTAQGRRVCIHMDREEDTERNDARQLVQLSEQKRFA